MGFRPTPYVPYTFGFSPEVTRRLAEYYQVVDPFVDLGMHIFAVGPRPARDWEPPACPPLHREDEFGVRWVTAEDGSLFPAGHPLQHTALEDFHWPDPKAAGRFDHVEETIQMHEDRFIVGVVNRTLLERAHFLRGFQELMLDMALRPRFVHQLLDRILEFDMAILDALLEFPIDGVWFGDDYGQQNGLIISPNMWCAFIKPRLALLFARAQAANLPVFLHSDGAVSGLIPDLLEIGLNVLNPLQPEVMDLPALKRTYGRDLVFCGGISTQRLLCRATPEQVEEELKWLAGGMAANGGYIAGTAGSVQADVPLPNLTRLLDLLRGQDLAPLNGSAG